MVATFPLFIQRLFSFSEVTNAFGDFFLEGVWGMEHGRVLSGGCYKTLRIFNMLELYLCNNFIFFDHTPDYEKRNLHVVLCLEAVLFSEVTNALSLWEFGGCRVHC